MGCSSAQRLAVCMSHQAACMAAPWSPAPLQLGSSCTPSLQPIPAASQHPCPSLPILQSDAFYSLLDRLREYAALHHRDHWCARCARAACSVRGACRLAAAACVRIGLPAAPPCQDSMAPVLLIAAVQGAVQPVRQVAHHWVPGGGWADFCYFCPAGPGWEVAERAMQPGQHRTASRSTASASDEPFSLRTMLRRQPRKSARTPSGAAPC